MAKDIEVKVKYIPDTSALKNATSNMSKIDFKFGNGNVKKELVAPVQAAMKEVNKALASGADSNTLLKLFQQVGKEADTAKTKASAMLGELNTVFNSSGNQKLLKDLEAYRKKLEETEKQITNWDKKYGNATMKQMKTDLKISGVSEARKKTQEFEEQIKLGKELTQQERDRYELMKKYVSAWNERQAATPKGELEAQASGHRNKISELEGQVQTPSYNIEETKRLTNIITQMGNAYGLSTQEINKLTAALKTQEDVAKEGKKELVKMGDVLTGTFLGTSISNLLQTGLSRGVEFFKEYDETLTRTMMVTGMTRDEVNGLTESYNKLANQLSSTTKDVAAAQLVFYQQGLGTREAMEMTEASIAISKTGGIEAAEAANRLTAAVKGYQLAANDAMDIADKMSALDAAAASSVDELTIAMQKSASQARMAGLDLDYYMAYLSTMQEVTREAPENIGTAMKSITSRMQEIRDIGKIEEDGTTFSNVAKALSSIGIAATDSSGQLRDLQGIMDELGPKWKTLDRNHKAYIATTLAGNRQQSRFIALMDNYDRAMELVDISQNASGESAKQLRAYNQGLEASFTALTNAWQQFATKLADSDIIKTVVDLLTDIIELVNKLPKGVTSSVAAFIALNTVFKTITAFSKVPWKDNFSKWLGVDKEALDDIKGIGGAFGDLSKKVKSAGDIMKNAFDGLGNNSQQLRELTEEMENNTVATEANQKANEENSATKEMDNSVDAGEVLEAQATQSAQVLMADAYKDSNVAVQAQLDLMSTNSDGYIQEQERAIREAQAQSKNAQQEEQKWAQANEDEKARRKNEILDLRKHYERKVKNPESWMQGGELYTEAEEILQGKGKLSKNRQMSLFGEDDPEEKLIQDEMKRLSKEYGIGYHEVQEILKKQSDEIFDFNNANLKKAQQRRKELNKEINALQKDLADYKKLVNGQEVKKKQINGRKQSIKGLEEYKKASRVSLADTKAIITDKNLGNFEKLSGILGKLNVASGFATGSFVKMAGSVLGLDEDISSAAGTFAGVGKTLSAFGPWGWAAAAAVAGLQFAFDKLWPSVEKTQKKLAEIQQEQDAINQKITNIEDNLKIYEDLSGKIGKTEEETQQLKDATEVLVETIPGCVAGYNSYGDAVLNTAKAYEELKKQQQEASALSDKSLEQFDKLQDGANRGEKITASILGIGSAIATVAGIITLNPVLAGAGLAGLGGAGIWGAELSDKQIEENRKVWDENYSEILANYQTKRDEFLLDVSEQNQDTASKVVDSFINSMMKAGRDGKISDATEAIEDLLAEFSDVSWARIEKAMTQLSSRQGVLDMTIGQARKFLEEELTQSLKDAGLTDIEIKGIITAVLNIQYDGAADVEALKDSINTEIENLKAGTGNEEQIKALEAMRDELSSLNQEELELLKNAGMLDSTYAKVFKNNGGMKKTLDSFRQQNGELNKQRAIIGSTNELIKQQEADKKKITEYEQKNSTELKNFEDGMKEHFWATRVGGKDHGKKIFQQERYDAVMKEYEERYNLGYRTGDNANKGGQTNGRGDNKYDGLLMDDYAWEEGFDAYVQYKAALEENNGKINELRTSTNKYEDEIVELMSKIESYAVPTFQDLADQISEMKESWESFLDLGEHLDGTGGILDGEGLVQLFELLGSYEDAAFQTTEQFEAWMHAIDGINQGISIENGQLKLTEGAMTSVNDLISYSTQLKANDMLLSVERGKAELENQKSVLEAQKAAVDAEIAKIKSMSDAEYQAAVKSGDLQADFKQSYIDLLDKTNLAEIDAEENKLNTMLTLNNGYFKQLASMRTAYANGEDVGDVQWLDIKGEYEKVYDRFVEETANSFTSLISNDKQGTLTALEAYSSTLGQQIGMLDRRINSEVQLKETIAKYLADDGTNYGKAFDDATKSASDYAEKLERTLTLLEKIEGIQHKIDENETFKSLYQGYDGESYGRIMMTNLKLAEEQYDVYKDLFAMQQEMTNQAAGDLLDSPYGQMFTIAENGDLGWASDEMYEKYKGLPDDMQEDIDNLVDAYQEQRDELRGTEKDLAKYAQAVKAAREELVQMEIEIENELVDALKNREKIMHDARVKAIDDETKMIEEAMEARKKAREEADNEKELYQAQEALRRATLDSSGKNNAQLLQLQQDLEDKQLEISEKRFEDDMEDRKNWLQDTKDAETETYEYRLETMTWYWENVQAIQDAGQEAMMQTLIHWNEEYRTTSQLQQSEMLREWEFTMDAMKTAADMGAELGQLTNDIVEVTTEVESMNISIDKLPGTWQKATDAANNYSAAAKQASSYKPTGYTPTSDPTNKPKDPGPTSNTDTSTQSGKKMKKDDKIEFRPSGDRTKKVPVYDEDGVSVGTYSNSGMGDKNGTAGTIKTINGERMVYFKPAGGYVATKHFQTQGDWGSSTRYYASGGMVDYTGPAWVDGTKTKPEAFLSPYQTEQIAALAGALDKNAVNSASTNSNVTFGSINFNVASMSSAADGKKALEMFVQGANDLMAKKGIGTKLNMNVK